MQNGLALITGTGGLTERIVDLAKSHSLVCRRYVIRPMLPRLTAPEEAATLHPFKFGQIRERLTADRIRRVLFCGNFPRDRFLQVWFGRRVFGTIRHIGDREFMSFYDRTNPKASEAVRYFSSLEQCLNSLGISLSFIKDLFPELIVPAGVLTQMAPPQSLLDELPGLLVALGRKIAGHSERLRLAQAAIVDGNEIVDVEAAGTDAMLRKFAGGDRRRALILLKPPSVEFSPALDQPTIGPKTVANCARAGMCGIVICAEITTIVDKERTLAELNNAGMFLYAIPLAQLARIYRENFDSAWVVAHD